MSFALKFDFASKFAPNTVLYASFPHNFSPFIQKIRTIFSSSTSLMEKLLSLDESEDGWTTDNVASGVADSVRASPLLIVLIGAFVACGSSAATDMA